eukprot:TCALIF_06199-PA protein Name:"Protein of unknown function" AED:0.31 eAED:0.34 QI:0/0/0/0.33/1/1/3/0/625
MDFEVASTWLSSLFLSYLLRLGFLLYKVPSNTFPIINQIKKSLFRRLKQTHPKLEIDLLYHQFYTGINRPLTEEEQETITQIATSEFMVTRLMQHWSMFLSSNTTNVDISKDDWLEFLQNNSDFVGSFDYVRDMAVENPGESSVLFARYGNFSMKPNGTNFLPFFGTDIGFCTLVKPQLTFNESLDHLSFSSKMFGPKGQMDSYSRQIPLGAKVGKSNGLTLLLDSETFDYTYHHHASEGFKLAIQHHLDQPLMSINELDITPGFESQVAVTPVLYDTTEDARVRFMPEERGCYFEGEVTLKYLPKELYRYDISNCLFEATYEKVLEICQCTPYFHWAGFNEYQRFCQGEGLFCMNDILSRIGEFNEVLVQETDDRMVRKKCLASCQDQQNQIAVTTSKLPNRQTFVERPEFCILTEKLQRSCSTQWKKLELDLQYPKLCDLLDSLKQQVRSDPAIVDETVCAHITRHHDPFNVNKSSLAHLFLETSFRYARDNLALVHIYIKQPVVTKIVRDQRIPVIWFVANCGGILGLCMGFSIVTVFEVLHYLFTSLFQIIKSKLPCAGRARRLRRSRRAESKSGNAISNGPNTAIVDLDPDPEVNGKASQTMKMGSDPQETNGSLSGTVL